MPASGRRFRDSCGLPLSDSPLHLGERICARFLAAACGVISPPKKVSQGAFELRITEVVASLLQPRGLHPLAREEQSVGHLADGDPDGRSRDGEEGRTVQDFPQYFRVLGVGEGVGAPDVDGALDGVVLERVMDGSDDVVESYPAPPLPAAPDPASPAQLEDGKGRAQSSTLWAQDESEARVDDADSRLPRGVGRRLPRLAHLGEEIRAGPAILAQELVSPVTVVADRRRADHNFRRHGETRDGLGEQACPLLAALHDALFPGVGPATLGDALASEVHYSVVAFEGAINRAGVRVPTDIVFPFRGTSQAGDAVAFVFELPNEGGPDQARRPADKNLHLLLPASPRSEWYRSWSRREMNAATR